MQTVPDTDLHYTVLYYDIGRCMSVTFLCMFNLQQPDTRYRSLISFHDDIIPSSYPRHHTT